MDGDGAAARWNHNIHYHPVVHATLPDAPGRVLDVGCGEGMLTREVAARAEHVVGIDPDEPSISLAEDRGKQPNVSYVMGDFLTYGFEPESFDAIVSVAALHHMDTAVALARMRTLLRPGGRLAVVGLARSRRPWELPLDIAGFIADQAYKRVKSYWDHSAPVVWPPPLTYGETKRLARRELPGVRYRRHLLFRYSLVWTKPAAP